MIRKFIVQFYLNYAMKFCLQFWRLLSILSVKNGTRFSRNTSCRELRKNKVLCNSLVQLSTL